MIETPSVCFLDLDGVLVDFYNPALKAVGLNKEEVEKKLPPGPEFWQLDGKFMTKDDFWGRIDSTKNFWENLPKTKEADEIIKICEKYFNDKVFFLTSPPFAPSSYSGKAIWVKNNYPKYYRKLFIGPEKQAFAHSKAVLIDDSDKNCRKFRDAGGKVILIPRRANSLYHREHELLEILQDELEMMFFSV